MADRVTVTLPWGSLLRAVALPDLTLLANIRAVIRPGGRLDVVYAIDAVRDAAALRALGLDAAQDGPSAATCEGYAAAGLRVDAARELAREDIAALGTTWARKLAAAPSGRRAWRIEATAV
jgi:16S rRNA (adenine(1408)-N(1))-methyltransferase